MEETPNSLSQPPAFTPAAISDPEEIDARATTLSAELGTPISTGINGTRIDNQGLLSLPAALKDRYRIVSVLPASVSE